MAATGQLPPAQVADNRQHGRTARSAEDHDADGVEGTTAAGDLPGGHAGDGVYRSTVASDGVPPRTGMPDGRDGGCRMAASRPTAPDTGDCTRAAISAR
jgi:hypothetical protein